MNEIERAMETIKHVSDLDTKYHLNISNYDLLIAIEALREKQEREKGCEYCTDLGKDKGIDCQAWEQRFADDFYEVELKSNYCPNCGRKLRED